jgi:hypothetical protein
MRSLLAKVIRNPSSGSWVSGKNRMYEIRQILVDPVSQRKHQSVRRPLVGRFAETFGGAHEDEL